MTILREKHLILSYDNSMFSTKFVQYSSCMAQEGRSAKKLPVIENFGFYNLQKFIILNKLTIKIRIKVILHNSIEHNLC